MPSARKPATSSTRLSHVDAEGTARMVDVGDKEPCRRTARAASRVDVSSKTVRALKAQALPKGDVLTVARLAGIQAAKRTDELIPLCHSLPLDHVDVHFRVRARHVDIQAEARTYSKTGVEMEALTAASVAALTIYDMCKAIDKKMIIGPTVLLEKTKAGTTAK